MLLGLLALQTGLVGQDELVSAFREWSRDKSRLLGEVLLQKNAIDTNQLMLITNLVDEYVKKYGEDANKTLAGLTPAPGAMERLAELRDPEIDATLAHVGTGTPSPTRRSLSEASDETEIGRRGSSPAPSIPGRNERFQIICSHARGGLGAVSVALDTELNREVALKQILDHHADDALSRARFLLEAEITGGLEHPNIVPVNGLGHDSSGRPYYAMRFVRGDSFKEAVDRFHADALLKRNSDARNLELQKLLRRFLAVCDAVGYAHQRGVIHRDIKPANIILGRHGETLLVDWGLAKTLGSSDPEMPPEEQTLRPSSSSGSAETLPGSAMGTPAYMSPEQSRGDVNQISKSTDNYGLGATLYYLLAGRAPFEGELLAVVRAVQEGMVKPIRDIVKDVDPALEAICLQAMAKLPDDRYHSARALAIDLERWIADQPVDAYREPWRRRLARWERRHRGLVHGGGLVMLIALTSLAVTAAVIQSEKNATDAARGLAEERAQEAAGNFKLALDSSYEMLSMVSDQQLSQMPGLTKTRLALSKSADRMFHRFIQADTAEPGLLKQAGRVKMNLAYAKSAVGDIPGASSAFMDGIRYLELREQRMGARIVDEKLQPLLDMQLRYLNFLEDRGLAESPTYRFRQIAGQARKGCASLMSRVRGKVEQDFWRAAPLAKLELIEAHFALGTGNLEQAQASFLLAKRLWTEFGANHYYWDQLYLSQAHRGLARVAQALQDERTADAEFQAALAIVRRTRESNPESIDPAFVLGWTLLLDGERLASIQGWQAEAESMLEEALVIARKQVNDFPEETRYLGLLASLQAARGQLDLARSRDDEAERELLAARTSFDALVTRRETDDLRRPAKLARVEIALSRILRRQGRADEADALLDAAGSRLPRIQSSFPNSAELKITLDELEKAAGSP